MSLPRTTALASEDWELTDDSVPKPGCLIVQQRRHAHVFPWFRFIHAEGDNSEVSILFSTHSVTVTGHGLAALVVAVSTQRLIRLIQPTENEAKFGVRGATRHEGPSITEITIEELK